jgi:hypothetical protein
MAGKSDAVRFRALLNPESVAMAGESGRVVPYRMWGVSLESTGVRRGKESCCGFPNLFTGNAPGL